jgi:predicted DCC family thiol-disulfide oxidoreductase YuxK
METESKPVPNASPALSVYFDGACPLCTAEINHYRGLDGADGIAFVDVSGASCDLPSGLDQAQALKRFHVRRADGTMLSGAAAFIALWAQMPSWAWAARIGALPGVSQIMEVFYRLSLFVRPALARLIRTRHG